MGLTTTSASLRKFVPHRLHDQTRSWPETNCYVDLWIEVLASLDLTPEAAFGSAVTQDFGLDQFTFSKIPLADLDTLYGLKVRELSIYRTLEQHVALHVQQGRLVVMEVDAFYLPDTAATTYRNSHTKTTIAINTIDSVLKRCEYFHNATHGSLEDDDYVGVMRLTPALRSQPDLLPPYVEIVDCPERQRPLGNLKDVSIALLRQHLTQRPRHNPFTAWRHIFAQQIDELHLKPERFNDYAFHFPRLAGSNFEILASHVNWLAGDELLAVSKACQNIGQTAKVLQFRLARNIARQRDDLCPDCFDIFESNYEKAIQGLIKYLG